MNTRARIALAALVFASAFAAGIVGGAHGYVAQISGTTEGAFMLSGLSGNQLAAEGGGGGSSPSPSTHPQPSHPTRDSGQGSTPSRPSNNPSNDGCGGCGGGSHPSSNGSGSTGGGHPSENSGNNAGDSFGGGRNNSGGGSNTGGNSNTGDSRDHQDTPASVAAEKEAQHVREAAQYAQQLGGAGSGDPTAAAHTPQSIAQKVGATVNALEQAMSNLMGGAAAPVENGGAGRIRGLDGDQPAYQGTQISPDDFRAPPPGTGMAQTPTGPSPEDLRQALRYGPGTQEAPAPHYVTSAATEKALNQLKHIDTEMMAQAAAFQKHLGNKIDTADSLVSVSEIDKTVAGECAKGGGCSDSERTAIANVIMNRINIAAANKPNLDIHDVLDAFDANMQAENQRKGGVPDNKVYATADVGTPQYAAGVTALNAALSGNLPKDIPDSVRLATNYYNPDSSNPSWSDNSTLGTQYGPHKFLSVNGSTPAQVQAANDKVAAGDIKADISFYKGMNDSASPQAAKIQTEVTRSLTVAGRKVDITTQSTGNAQGPSIHQSTQGSGSSHQIGGVGTPQQAPATAQKTSLDDPTNSNVPSPADVRKFITARGWPADKPIDGQYAYRLSNIVARAETATGKKAPSNYFSSTYRSPEEQAQIKATSLGHSIVYNGVTYPPDMSNKYVGTNFKAAWPGDSPHQYGEAVDTVDTSKMKDPQAKAAADAINHYIQSNTPMHIALRDAGIDPKTGLPPVSADPSQTGLERVTNDQNHVQLAGFKPRAADNTMNKLDSSIGAGAVPDTTSAPKSWLSNIPSLADIKQKAADAVKAVTPSEATKQKLSWVSGLPTWMQSVVVSVYTGKGGTAPSDNGNTGSHGGSSFFPEAQRATTTISSRTITKINVTQIPWWQQYQAKLNAIKQSKQQQSI